MPFKKLSALDSVLGRLDDLDSVNLANLAKRLARERQLLETIVNTIREGILVVSHDGIIHYANAAGQRIVGMRSGEEGRAILWKYLPELALTLNLNSLGELTESTMVSRELELTYPERRVVRLYLVPMEPDSESGSDNPEREDRHIVILSDVTQDHIDTNKRIENEKVSSIILLAAGVAHELGNPLNSLTIHLQLIRRKLQKVAALPEDTLDKLLAAVDVCSGEVDRLDTIITHFLEAVRPTPPDLQDIDLLRLLEEVIEFQGEVMKNAGISIDISFTRDIPVVLADRNQIKQVFFNILKNACEAMAGGGEIRIQTRDDDEFVYVLIGDNGEGISEENLSRVFDPYFTTKEEGNGLGMMIVRRIMHEHGGQIGIDSRPGTGTLVTLQFPKKHRRIRLLE